VEARLKGKSRWFTGTIVHINEDSGTFDVDYVDGEKEQGVPRQYIRTHRRYPTVGLVIPM
jgi:uncharacterized protein YkvS